MCLIKLRMRLPHIGVIALINEIFFGGDIVIKTAFGEPQAASDVRQCGGARTFGVEQFGGARQHSGSLGFSLQATAERGALLWG